VALDPLGNEHELALMYKLAEFPEEVRLAAQRREPQRIPRYLQELSAAFHSFYNHCRVLGEAPELEAARLALLDATRIVLARGLQLLGVSAPQTM
ncbi:MAG TPA: DALR anticodon-binding domain-containing protein, partial [Porticoccaceae bacterium]|nr:DALR anticodon-binding domain-containing protein [Porticoccaceae bacterium]